MGGSPTFGGMWPAQVSRDMVLADDAGRPTSLASDVAFIPLQVQATPVGNPETTGLNESAEPPALFTVRLIVGSGVREYRLPFRAGLSIKHYLRELGLIGARMRLAMNIDGRCRVQMAYVPKQGEILHMVHPLRPLLQLRSP